MTVFQRMVMGARARLAKEVELCVLPNEERVDIFKRQTGTNRPVECVWNVPGLEDIGPRKPKPNLQTPLKLFYGGSLAPARLSPLILQEIIKLAGRIELEIVGYATYDAQTYIESFVRLNDKTGNKSITYHGALAQRGELLAVADRCEAALCLMPMSSQDLNMRTMAGASNKPFDAMARGLAVVVSDLPAWTSMYLQERKEEAGAGRDAGPWIPDAREVLGANERMSKDPRNPEFRIPDPGKGYGIAIDPESDESIRAGLKWMLNNREKLWEMGERGRQKIQNEWNYKRLFQPVLDRLRVVNLESTA